MLPENLEQRVTALESQVRELADRVRASEQDAAAARVLAGAADRDVTEFVGEFRDFRRATIGSFNALREDFTALREEMTERFSHVEERFSRVDDGFTEMRGKLDRAAAGNSASSSSSNNSSPTKADAPGSAQYGGCRSGNIGKWRTLVVSRSASTTMAVAAIR